MKDRTGLLAAARAFVRAEGRLSHHTITEGDLVERNRAERELCEAAEAYAGTAPLDARLAQPAEGN